MKIRMEKPNLSKLMSRAETWDLRPETWDLSPETWDLRLETFPYGVAGARDRSEWGRFAITEKPTMEKRKRKGDSTE